MCKRKRKEYRLCTKCEKRPALYFSPRSDGKLQGNIRYSPDHDLCQQCFRGEKNRHRDHKEKDNVACQIL